MSLIYILLIEGISGPSARVRYCYNGLPRYADANYNTGLAEPPSGVSAQWDVAQCRVSTGRWTVLLRHNVGPFSWYHTRPRPVTELAERMALGSTLVHRRTNAAAGIEEGTTLYCGRETMRAVDVDPDETFCTVLRPIAASRASAHAQGSDVYLVPPALIGRRAVVKVVDADAEDESEERLLVAGYIASDPVANIHSVSITMRDQLNWKLQASRGYVARLMWPPGMGWPTTVEVAVDPPPGLGPSVVTPAPILRAASGGYWYLPEQKLVYPAEYGGSGIRSRWSIDWTTLIRSPEARPPDSQTSRTTCRQVLLSDTDMPYPIIGSWAAIGPSDHPIDLALVMLLTRDGTGGDYDLGADASLFPKYSLGLDPSEVDIDSFLAVKQQLFGVRAQRLWIGVKEQSIEAVFDQLFAPLGVAVGRGRDGRWRALMMRDVYPTDQVVRLDRLIRPAEWEHSVLSRSLDRMDVYVDPAPEGDGLVHHEVREEELRDLYPEQIGGSGEFKRAPYASPQWDNPAAPCVPPATKHIARSSQKQAMVRVVVGPTYAEQLEIGTFVTLSDSAIRDPTTGQKLGGGGV